MPLCNYRLPNWRYVILPICIPGPFEGQYLGPRYSYDPCPGIDKDPKVLSLKRQTVFDKVFSTLA